MKKKTKQTTSTKTRYEHFVINHNGIRVDVVVDYNNMTVSLVDKNREKRNYMFCERSIRFANGWYNVLDALKEAMEIGFNKLEERRKEDEIAFAEKVIALQED